ncbi:MAG: hypothetical protein NTU83_07405 [Candidatus Hydrogenedentes bacterium]|nr:hypothetical protein [Candidatus Hydrogenedentota bacterium]
MAITLGTVTFDETHTTAQEKHEEVGGRDARRIVLAGLIVGEASVEAIDARLDTILDAASLPAEAGGTALAALSLRAGRRLWVQRLAFSREVARGSLVGSFTLQVEAPDPFEESVATHAVDWTISVQGATRTIASTGNVASPAVITIVATGRLVNPSFGDGTATLVYSGIVEAGHTLRFDGVASAGGSPACVLLDDEDVTPYTSGTFPRIAPEGTTLTYHDDVSSAHTCAATLSYRDRWW